MEVSYCVRSIALAAASDEAPPSLSVPASSLPSQFHCNSSFLKQLPDPEFIFVESWNGVGQRSKESVGGRRWAVKEWMKHTNGGVGPPLVVGNCPSRWQELQEAEFELAANTEKGRGFFCQNADSTYGLDWISDRQRANNAGKFQFDQTLAEIGQIESNIQNSGNNSKSRRNCKPCGYKPISRRDGKVHIHMGMLNFTELVFAFSKCVGALSHFSKEEMQKVRVDSKQHVRRRCGHEFKDISTKSLQLGMASLSLSHQKESKGTEKGSFTGLQENSGTTILPASQEPNSRLSVTNSTSESSKAMFGDTSERTDASKEKLDTANKANTKSGKVMSNFSVLERAEIGAVAGGIAGAFTYACLHPLDTVKTKLQTRGASDVYSGSLDVILKVLQNEGILGFYSGISAVLIGSTISSAIYFGTCEFGKSFLSKFPIIPPLIIPPLAGAMGNIVSSSILVPKEVITQKMQAGAAGRSWQVLSRIIQTEGLRGLYVGYSAALLRNLPTSVLSFSTFEYLKGAWLANSKKASLEPWQSVTSGAIAGAIAATLTTPLDVVKTRLMTQSTASIPLGVLKTKVSTFTYKGVSSTLKQIWIEEGWIGLTRGVGPRLLHSACFSAIGFFAFETARLAIVKQQIESRVSRDRKYRASLAAPVTQG